MPYNAMLMRGIVRDYLDCGDTISAKRVLEWLVHHRLEPDELDLALALMMRSASKRFRLLAFLALRASGHDCPAFREAFGLGLDQYRLLMSAPVRKACFPIANPLGGFDLAESVCVLLPGALSPTICLSPDGVGGAKVLSALVGSGFLIGFTRDFSGESWMLSAAAALLGNGEAILDRLAFSGRIDPQGCILPCGELSPKAACAKKHGKRLLTSELADLQALSWWLQTDRIPVPVVQVTGDENVTLRWLQDMEAAVRADHPCFTLQLLERFYGLDPCDLAIYGGTELEFDPKVWHSTLKLAGEVFARIDKALAPAKSVVWYAGKISSLQFGIGAVFGFKRPVCICQLDFQAQVYRPVIRLDGDVNPRILKNVGIPLDKFGNIEYKYEPNDACRELALVLYLGSHNPLEAVRSYLKEKEISASLLFVSLRESQGDVNILADWLPLVREINALVNHLKSSCHWDRIHLFQTAPTAACLALGIAFGHFMPVSVYHFQSEAEVKKTYKEMYRLDDLSCLVR